MRLQHDSMQLSVKWEMMNECDYCLHAHQICSLRLKWDKGWLLHMGDFAGAVWN